MIIVANIRKDKGKGKKKMIFYDSNFAKSYPNSSHETQIYEKSFIS